MVHPQEKQWIKKFLERNYPVQRVKCVDRFKRAIFKDNTTYYLSDKTQIKLLYYSLLDIVKKVFNSPDNVNISVLKAFLNLK